MCLHPRTRARPSGTVRCRIPATSGTVWTKNQGRLRGRSRGDEESGGGWGRKLPTLDRWERIRFKLDLQQSRKRGCCAGFLTGTPWRAGREGIPGAHAQAQRWAGRAGSS